MIQKMKRKKLVLYIGHTFDLAYFIRLMPLINKEKQFHVTSIVAKGYYFRNMINLKEYLNKISDESIIIPDNKIPIYGKNILRNLYRAFHLRKLIKVIDKNKSILISIDKSAFMANFLNSYFKNVILIQASDSTNFKIYKKAYLRIIHYNILNILTKSKLITILFNQASKGHIWHYRIINPHYHDFYLGHKSTFSQNRIALPSVASNRVSKKVIIFGSRYNSWRFTNSKLLKSIFTIYENLSQELKGYDILYKPHPLETGSEFEEINKIFNYKLINVGISLNSELFLIENNDIDYCFSLCSTSSRSAYQMGFNSRVFYKMATFDRDIEDEFDNIFSEMPKSFWIKEFHNLTEKVCLKSIKTNVIEIRACLNDLSYM
jgi:hypothetical protein